MNIVSTLTLRHLKENKKRTVVTILGIAASTALITTMLIGVTSFFAFFGRLALYESGDWQGEFKNISAEKLQELKEDQRIKDISVVDADYSISGVRMNTEVSERRKLGNIVNADSTWIVNKTTCQYEGTLPSNENEIAVEEKFLQDNNIDAKVGDTISFELGNRSILDENGKKLYIAGSYRSQEKFEHKEDVTYTITAIFHGNKPTSSFDIVHCISADTLPKENLVDFTIYKLNHNSYQELVNIAKDHDLHYEDVNTEYLLSLYSYNKDSRGVAGIIPLGIGALCIIVFTAIILIYNTFGMSLAEKMKYLGMLASVGATKKQKRRSIYFEGAILGLFGIPLGLLLGYLGAFVTLRLLGGKIIASSMIEGAKNVGTTIPVSAPYQVYIFIVVISAITIFVSAFIPAIRASRVMPIDALRQSNVIKVKSRKLRVNPLVKKLFGYEGEIAYKNIKRNGAKGKVITLSIAVSMVMFLSISHFCFTINQLNRYDWELPYQITVSCTLSEGEQLREAIEEVEGVDKVYSTDFITYNYNIDKDNPNYATPNPSILNTDYLKDGYKDAFDSKTIVLCTIPDEDFMALLHENGIDEKEYFSGELKGVLANSYRRAGRKEDVFNESIIGQRMFYDDQTGNPPAVEIAGLVEYDEDNYIFKLIPKQNLVVYVPESVFDEKAAEILGEDATKGFAVCTDNPTEVYERIMELLETEEFHKYYCSNVSDMLESMNVITLLLKTVMYGFTGLITMIVLANLINTISTGVIMRRKEFAMLRSVGMTSKGFKKMLSLETLLYGTRAIIVGIPLSLLCSYYMTRRANEVMAFQPNILMYILAILVIFAVLGCSMLLSVNKVKDDDIIDVLKEDIC